MGKDVIVSDVRTLNKLLNPEVLSSIQNLDLEMIVLDWLKLNSVQQSLCIKHGICSVTLTEKEVIETFQVYQQDANHSVCIEQYGALVYAIRHDAFFASFNPLIQKLGEKFGIAQYWLIDGKDCLLPIYTVNGLINSNYIAV
ncbi:MAG: hypothetical protein HUJ96_00100 [Marinilabiliaceae bacterium]|nr:hypothetical protein [Marinilabiliaceae bacterium]